MAAVAARVPPHRRPARRLTAAEGRGAAGCSRVGACKSTHGSPRSSSTRGCSADSFVPTKPGCAPVQAPQSSPPWLGVLHRNSPAQRHFRAQAVAMRTRPTAGSPSGSAREGAPCPPRPPAAPPPPIAAGPTSSRVDAPRHQAAGAPLPRRHVSHETSSARPTNRRTAWQNLRGMADTRAFAARRPRHRRPPLRRHPTCRPSLPHVGRQIQVCLRADPPARQQRPPRASPP